MPIEGVKNCCYNNFWTTTTNKVLLAIYVLAIGLLVLGSYGMASGKLPLALSRNFLISGGLAFVGAFVISLVRGNCEASISKENKAKLVTQWSKLVCLYVALEYVVNDAAKEDSFPDEYKNKDAVWFLEEIAKETEVLNSMGIKKLNTKDNQEINDESYKIAAKKLKISVEIIAPLYAASRKTIEQSLQAKPN